MDKLYELERQKFLKTLPSKLRGWGRATNLSELRAKCAALAGFGGVQGKNPQIAAIEDGSDGSSDAEKMDEDFFGKCDGDEQAADPQPKLRRMSGTDQLDPVQPTATEPTEPSTGSRPRARVGTIRTRAKTPDSAKSAPRSKAGMDDFARLKELRASLCLRRVLEGQITIGDRQYAIDRFKPEDPKAVIEKEDMDKQQAAATRLMYKNLKSMSKAQLDADLTDLVRDQVINYGPNFMNEILKVRLVNNLDDLDVIMDVTCPIGVGGAEFKINAPQLSKFVRAEADDIDKLQVSQSLFTDWVLSDFAKKGPDALDAVGELLDLLETMVDSQTEELTPEVKTHMSRMTGSLLSFMALNDPDPRSEVNRRARANPEVAKLIKGDFSKSVEADNAWNYVSKLLSNDLYRFKKGEWIHKAWTEGELAKEIVQGLETYDLKPDVCALVTLTTSLIDWTKRARSGGMAAVTKAVLESMRKFFDDWTELGGRRCNGLRYHPRRC